MNNVRQLSAVLMCAGLMLTAVACGTTDESESGSADAKSGSANATIQPYNVNGIKKDPAIASLVPSSVTEDNQLTVGMETSYAPAEFLEADGKTPTGYDVDLTNAIARVWGLKPNPTSASFDSIIPAIGSKYDLGISSFTITKDREQTVDMVSYYKAGMSYVVKKGNPQKIDTKNMCGVSMGVQTGTIEEQEADTNSKKCAADGKKAMNVQSFKMQTDATTAVLTGKIDAFYADSPVAGYAVAQTGDQLQTVGEDEGVVPQGIVLKKGDTKLGEAVQKTMQKFIDDGTYGKILKHWGVQGGAIDKAELNPSVE
ncbi:MAG: ABC transporter substrate-binding protein [Bifidobacterium aquikefiri]|uniref:ABC transporter substrate-binding protein n=1 Tax=Bifidobacterium aquikefiri TaxID=1653207 RepID=A0A261G2Z5_9BIFI|nr:ABC transporter substrate-binding protein [Bifidobacterium aquikefiri]OZG65595.1 ABC transporter substrate-binding protein [Bifidobacterium aquikefiri]